MNQDVIHDNAIKKVVITGAANGIGKATAIACVEAGYYVIAADKDRLGLQALQACLPTHRLETHLADFSQPQVYQSFIDDLYDRHRHCALEALVNNAGLYHGKSVYDYSHEEVEEIWAVNLKSLVYLSKDFARRESRATHTRSIVNVTSVAGEVGSMDALYGATKAGVIGLTKANAWNFAPRVRVNAVSPALVRDTSIHDRIPEHRRREYERQEIIDAPLQPEGVADVILFLLSAQSRHLTGKVIAVDNGVYPR
jgi:3-oxoacyl-[acyl-carrier protein] reductase